MRPARYRYFQTIARHQRNAGVLLSLIDIGDIIGVEGLVRRTKRGELTINAEHITML